MNSYNNLFQTAADIPATPLPNPGEGGPVAGGNGGGASNIPVIPLPNPGEGGPVANGNGGITADTPVIPLPNPGEGGPVADGNGGIADIPVIPLPNPGEGGPVANGPYFSIITMLPRPNVPCFFCNSSQSGNVRFLNTAFDYNPFLIYINNQLVVNSLGFAEVSQYGRVSSGFQTITISGLDGYVYIQKTLMFNTGSTQTIAITRTASGLDLTQINDSPCATPGSTACFRACNLSYNSGPLDVILNTGYMLFNDVRFQEVTPFSRIRSGEYQFYVATTARPGQSSQALVSAYISARANSIYTLYIFNWGNSPQSIRTLVVEDRR